jgi:hypothetical protein
MKELATFVGGSGESIAVIYEADDRSYWKVNYGQTDTPNALSRVFMTESEATDFASMITNKGNKPTFLSE